MLLLTLLKRRNGPVLFCCFPTIPLSWGGGHLWTWRKSSCSPVFPSSEIWLESHCCFTSVQQMVLLAKQQKSWEIYPNHGNKLSVFFPKSLLIFLFQNVLGNAKIHSQINCYVKKEPLFSLNERQNKNTIDPILEVFVCTFRLEYFALFLISFFF